MTDLISRQAAIERATKDHDFYRGATLPTDKARRDELLNVMCWLNELPSADPPWILCSERLPEDGERVLATHLGGLNPNRQVIEHVYANGEFTMGWDMDMNMDSPTFGQRYMGEVIAWKPLPKPYEGDKE